MFIRFLLALRRQGVKVGTADYLSLLDALTRGLITDLDGLYVVGRAIMCRSHGDFDGWDLAFAQCFQDALLPEDVRAKFEEWLKKELFATDADKVDPGMSDEELMRTFLKRLAEQKEEHNGGNRWIGTGGTSPFGHSGRAAKGIRVGGEGGGRGAITGALERQYEDYRSDRLLEIRDWQVALRQLRKLSRQGRWELDLDDTIEQTCQNAGDITLVERRERQNQVHVVLLMDTGGSMTPHFDRVSQLFSAAMQMNTFKSFTSYRFHNCVYGNLYNDMSRLDRIPTEEVLRGLTHRHRLIFVGDASMAPYELFAPFSWPGDGQVAGIDWLRLMKKRCPSSVWLNPDPRRWWNHPTVNAIGNVFDMHELTLKGLSAAIRSLKASA